MLPWTRRNPQSSLPISVVDDVEKSYHNPHAAESLNSKSPDQRTVLCKESQESSLPLGMANVEAAKPDNPAAEVFNPRTATRFRQHTIMIQEYLWQASPSFRSLEELMKKGWENPEADKYFSKQRLAIVNAGPRDKKMLFNRMRSLGKEIDDATGAFCYPHPHTLDLCMAPGGYSATVLDGHPDATIRGVSLPRSLGGYRLMVRYDRRDPRVQVKFMDITMLAAEFGVRLNDIPSHHPDASQFVSDRPFLGQDFDIVICDGQVLKEHIRGEWREYYEATRLLMSQLILGLQRIKKGGTFVMLLHKFATWYTCTLLKTFDAFSSVTLFKPESMHAKKSTFYLVAKNVQPQSGPAKEAVKEWKKVWYLATFGGDEGRGSFQEDPSEELVAAFLEEFGSRLVQLGETIWGVQTRALENAPYARKGHLGYTADVDGTPLHRWHKVPYGTSLPAGTGDNQCGGIVEDSELRGIMVGRRM